MTQTPITPADYPHCGQRFIVGMNKRQVACGRLAGHAEFSSDEHAPYLTGADMAELDRRNKALVIGEDATAHITIELSIDLDLSPDEVWPDGDIPKGWTAADVLALVKATGGLDRFLSEWGAGAEAGVSVHARGAYERGTLR